MQIDNVERGIVPFKNKTKTKCTKMTDESNLIKNGINGASTSVTTNDKRVFCGETGGNVNSIRKKCGLAPMPGEQDDCQAASNAPWNLSSVSENTSAVVSGADVQTSQQGIGGRLQFFKDGKFILELARTREGEKEGWVSVPRKAFWPLSTSTIIYPKNESSASLSFSDDNSSIQSSPWQRDHCWKQASPRKNISKEMCLIFKRTKNFTFTKNGYKMAQIKKRKPYDTSICKMPFNFLNGFTKVNSEDEVDSRDVKLEKTVPERNVNGNEKKCKPRAKLTDIIQKLIDKLPTGLFYLSKTAIVGGTVHHFSSTPSRIAELHHPQQHVSPRKRILREFEKVSLEDSSNKRCRAKNSSGFTTASTTTVVSQTVNVSSPCPVTSNVTRSGQISNGTSTEQNAAVSTPSRLYSSYSIHSLLGNACSSKTENKDTNSSQHPREMNDPSYLRLMLASSKTQDSNKSSSSAFTNHIKKSPTYSSYYDSNNHSKSPSRDLEHNSSRFKSIGSIAVSNSTSFHPYLSSPKYTSPSNPLANAPNDSYKIRSGRTSGSPNHQINVPTNRRSSPHSAFTQSPQSSSNVRYSSQTSPNSSRARDIPCSGNISPKLDRREGMPRTVPKKAATLRQQFSVPSSSPSTSQVESTLSHISASEQKKKSLDDRTVSPEQLYHPSVELDHNIGGVLRSSAIPPSALYYMYPRHGSPSAHTSPSYIPPVSYYNPYAAAVAALRNPLWMHYQAGVVPAAGTPSRLGPAMFPYNGASPGPPSIPSPLSSIHLPTATLSPWTPSNQQTLSTEDPVSLANKKDEQSSDAPLNLSKH